MKTNSKSKLGIMLVALITLGSVFSSCSEEQINETVATEEVAEIVAGSLASETQGMTAQLEASAKEYEEAEAQDNDGGRTEQEAVCGQEFSDQFVLQSPANIGVYYDYTFAYVYSFECNQFMVPNLMQFSMTQSGDLDAPRFSSVSSSKGGWMLSGLELSSTVYTIGGDYEREGVHSSKIGEQGSFDFNLTLTVSDIKMNKGNYIISQGKGSFTIEGSAPSGESFSASGSLEYLGNQEVLLTINEDTYSINLKTGEVTPL